VTEKSVMTLIYAIDNVADNEKHEHLFQIEQVEEGLRRIPNVTVYRREKTPKRFHYSKPAHRLGDITALSNNEGDILSDVRNRFIVT
jgi:hypothetical protein